MRKVLVEPAMMSEADYELLIRKEKKYQWTEDKMLNPGKPIGLRPKPEALQEKIVISHKAHLSCS